jgi:hypothetical protein
MSYMFNFVQNFPEELPYKEECTCSGTGMLPSPSSVLTGVMLDGSLQERAHEGG